MEQSREINLLIYLDFQQSPQTVYNSDVKTEHPFPLDPALTVHKNQLQMNLKNKYKPKAKKYRKKR